MKNNVEYKDLHLFVVGDGDLKLELEQLIIDKDIGIWLVNGKNIENLDKYFTNDTLKNNYLSWENSKVKFFSLDNLPRIKNKQENLIKDIKDFLKSKNLHH